MFIEAFFALFQFRAINLPLQDNEDPRQSWRSNHLISFFLKLYQGSNHTRKRKPSITLESLSKNIVVREMWVSPGPN